MRKILLFIFVVAVGFVSCNKSQKLSSSCAINNYKSYYASKIQVNNSLKIFTNAGQITDSLMISGFIARFPQYFAVSGDAISFIDAIQFRGLDTALMGTVRFTGQCAHDTDMTFTSADSVLYGPFSKSIQYDTSQLFENYPAAQVEFLPSSGLVYYLKVRVVEYATMKNNMITLPVTSVYQFNSTAGTPSQTSITRYFEALIPNLNPTVNSNDTLVVQQGTVVYALGN